MNLRPLTYELPKALLPVHDKPLLAHTIESLSKTGFKEVILVTGHLGNKIKEEFGDGQHYGVRIDYCIDEAETGTAQAIKSVQKNVGNDPFLLIYGDVLADIDWLNFIEFHKSQSSYATMAVTTVQDTDSWGMVKMQGNKVIQVEEKSDSGICSHMINSGIFVINPEVLSEIDQTATSFETDILPKLIQQNKLHGYHFSGKWFDIGSPEDYESALQEW
jgi:NDP-sugar pyrophosphorylase family protein